MDPATIELVLSLLQAAAQLTPTIVAALPAAEAALNGTATTDQIAQLEAVRDQLNAQAQAAEQKVIDGGPLA